MNVVILRGVLTRPLEIRELASGTMLGSFDLSTVTESGSAAVPVAWFDPPSSAHYEVGDEVVVTGEVRRRFFRAGGATQSRTEVIAKSVVRGRNRRAVVRAAEDVLRAATEEVSGSRRKKVE